MLTNISRLLATGLLLGHLGIASAQVAPDRPESLRVNMQNNLSVKGHFAVGPTRFLLRMQPGETRSVEIQITNREGQLSLYLLGTQDFTADEQGSPKFYGEDVAGPYPARHWLEPELRKFELLHGERAFIHVNITVPRDAEPGDHQAAVVIRSDEEIVTAGGVNVISSVASLFIITVEGDIIEDGRLLSIAPKRNLNWSTPLELLVTTRNDGTVHLIPTGTIAIKNIFGITVDEILVADWVILRNSTRSRAFAWLPRFALGRYTATTDLVLNSDAGETLTSPVSTSFWVIPLLPVLIVLLAIFLVSFLVQFFLSRFEISRKGLEDIKPSAKPKSSKAKRNESDEE